jgi:hypothetical protein
MPSRTLFWVAREQAGGGTDASGDCTAANSDGRAPDKCHNEENRSPPGAAPSAGWAPWLGPTGKRRLVESGSHFALDD